MNQPDPAEIEKSNVDTEAIAAADRILNEWRMEDSGELWCPVEEQPRLVHAVTAPLLAALATEREKREKAERNAEKAWDQVDDISTDNMQRLFPRLAATEAVVEAAEKVYPFCPTHMKRAVDGATHCDLCTALANYHKATGPQAENEGGR